MRRGTVPTVRVLCPWLLCVCFAFSLRSASNFGDLPLGGGILRLWVKSAKKGLKRGIFGVLLVFLVLRKCSKGPKGLFLAVFGCFWLFVLVLRFASNS